ncbi:deoxyribodipyrimidine photo-lyase [Zafaria cholistanensis]|uniref:Deoxyribodipyrimidine photo-lyase n=1 Tax=Zafaria cholistanensis TaxID=1682741 RepID=A0A5A7NKQ5_9MICC|nr:deoxyribodipyrimidine photo-lyase [Zafaria cholistanensis]GER21553.1 deoxyribodipyrimidine photo-lyase [Zafaria cholistanensis]
MKPSLVWFRDDLRVQDHPALLAAVADGAAVGLFVLDEASPGVRPLGAASRWWLHHGLEDLGRSLAELGIPLLLRRGPAATVLPEVLDALGAGAVYWNRRYGGPEREVDAAVERRATADGIHAETFAASLLHEPWTVRTGQGGPYRVFTPFWKAASARPVRSAWGLPDAGRGAVLSLPECPDGEGLEAWGLLPPRPDWAGGLGEAWEPGVAAGEQLLEDFASGPLHHYDEDRDRPDLDGTSRLSPYLRWGHLSPFQVRDRLLAAGGGAGASVFATQVGWREFCWHQLHEHPHLATTNLRREFDAFPWSWPQDGAEEAALTEAWRRGRTGIELVDAGQRELWATGWMHNRVRMVSASFLVKNLGIHWRVGEEWFWDTLVDADAALNAANWQWVAGCGADAAPFFRIFNPNTQAKKFDPERRYISRWVPEAGTPAYPEPVVDLGASRRRALEDLASLRAEQRPPAVS